MARTTIDNWNRYFLESSAIFESIKDVATPFTLLNQWPTLAQFDAEFTKRNIQSFDGKAVHPVTQGYTPEKFDDLYESRIYLKGELQTRLENWHDFFNALCWLQFPKIKSTLNKLHFSHSQTRQAGTNRSPLENAIALFDECGAIIVSDSEKYLQMIHNHQWKEIFFDLKDEWDQKEKNGHIQCYVFGHAMHEKALTPYIGMTTQCILLKKEPDFFKQDYADQLKAMDTDIAAIWQQDQITNTRDLQPLPVLGVPGWYSMQNEHFYNNSDYFRPIRKAGSSNN